MCEKDQKHRCQWNEYTRWHYRPDLTKAMASDCWQPATQRIQNRQLTGHLCDEHKVESINESRLIKELAPERNDSREYVPIEPSVFRCDAILEIRNLDGAPIFDDGIVRCSKPATQLEICTEEIWFCIEHARKYNAIQQGKNIDDLQQEQFICNNTILPNNQIMCTRKGCGKTGEGNLAHLPEGWRMILVAPGSVFKWAYKAQADWGSALCPEHAKEVNDLLID
ncbi:MAG: hypothetical protein WAU62_02080 [Dehalococcoidales bacterium]